MTFAQIRTRIKDYCLLSSSDADTRIGNAINAHYRRITSSLGMNATRFVTRSVATTAGQQYVTFTEIEKIDRIRDTTVSSGIRMLQEVSMHELRSLQVGSAAPTKWALRNTDADDVTVLLDSAPQDAYTLAADGWTTVSDLSGSDEPAFPESYHDILVWFVISEELLKKEKFDLAARYEQKADKLLADLRFHLADSPTLETQQGSGTPTSGGGSGSSGAASLGGTAYTQEALLTFDLGSGVAPFAVAQSNAPYVANLGAEFLGNIAASRLIGRGSAGGTGESEQITLGNQFQMSTTELRMRHVFNVKDYGALGDAATDDTVAIQAAIDAAKAIAAGPAHGTLTRAGIVYFPPGAYCVSHLDCTRTVGLELIGKANWGVTLYASKQVTTGKPVIDLLGSIGCYVRGIVVSGYTPAGAAPSVKPTVGWLVGETTAGGDSTAHTFVCAGTEGHFSAAALYIFGGTNHTFIDCGFSQTETAKPAIFIGNSNVDSVASSFRTIQTGNPTTGEISFDHCEIHGANNGAATNETTRLVGTYSIRIKGGVHDSSADRHIRCGGTCRNILIQGVQVYSESGTAATNFLYNDAGTINQLSLINLDFNDNGFDVGGGGVLLAGSGTINVLDIFGISSTYVVEPLFAGGTLTATSFPRYVSWTPVIGGSGGTSGQSYSVQVGRAAKIGEMVHAHCYVRLSTKGTITGNVQIQGVPFTSKNTTNLYSVAAVTWQSLNANKVNVTAALQPNTTVLDLYGLAAAGADAVGTQLVTADIADTTGFIVSITYRATA